MFFKIFAVVVISLGMLMFPETKSYAIPFFLVALVVVVIIEGIRIVPQQNAWVV